jgi:hypothetical protein
LPNEERGRYQDRDHAPDQRRDCLDRTLHFDGVCILMNDEFVIGLAIGLTLLMFALLRVAL